MQNRKLQSLLDDIDYIGSNCVTEEADAECQAHWVRYLCLLVAGFLENALYEVYRDYFDRTGRDSVRVRRIQNPDTDDFLDIATHYNQSWANALRDFMSDSGRGFAVNTIIRQRNNVAHGFPSSITMAQIAEYLPKCVAVVEFIEDKLIIQTQSNP